MAETDKNVTPAAAQPQPGQVVTPGSTAPQTPSPAMTAAPAAPQTPAAPAPAPSPTTPTDAAFVQDTASMPPPTPTQTDGGTISWTASEFVAHEKSAGWYLALAGIAVAVTVLIFVITRDITSIIVVLVAAVCFGVLGSRKPKQQQYVLSPSGLSIGQKHYRFNEFRSFAVVPEGAFSSIVFMPLKRFAPLTTIYYAPEDEDKIVDIIADNLPFEERKADPVDSLMKRIRF